MKNHGCVMAVWQRGRKQVSDWPWCAEVLHAGGNNQRRKNMASGFHIIATISELVDIYDTRLELGNEELRKRAEYARKRAERKG